MSDLDLVIRGGTIVTAAETARADVGVREGKIVALGLDLGRGKKEIDASGLLVMPGGIDSHVHLAQPAFGGPAMADGFETGTRSAIAGGNTTVLPFALQARGESLRQAVEDYHKEADGQSFCDFGFHMIVANPSPAALGQDLPALVASGYTSLKVFMTYDDLVLNDREILEVFDAAGECGALVMVHCEGYDAIRFMTEKLEKSGRMAPYYHAVSRPQSVEREAAHRAISHAELTGVPIMVVHVSGREAMEQIRWAQSRGLRIMGETCTQYISLTADDLKGLNMDETGSKYVCSPAGPVARREPRRDLQGNRLAATLGPRGPERPAQGRLHDRPEQARRRQGRHIGLPDHRRAGRRGMIRVSDLETMDRAALVAAWTDLVGTAVPKGMSKPFLRRFLAAEIQARHSGGLPRHVAAALRRPAEPVSAKTRATPGLKPGGRLLREWNGVTHVVEVAEQGFTWKGETWRSLSAIAREITGAHWSGPRFFGLTGKAAP